MHFGEMQVKSWIFGSWFLFVLNIWSVGAHVCNVDGTGRLHRLVRSTPPAECRLAEGVDLGSYPFERFEPGKSPKIDRIVNATRHAWNGYAQYAWGYDELAPLSKSGVNTFNGIAVTIIDGIDTLYMMGLEDEYNQARDYILHHFYPEEIGLVSVFETTIRILGGLLSIYHLTGDEEFLDVAENVGMRLGVAFNSPSGLPFPQCTLSAPYCTTVAFHGFSVVLAEAGTLQLEFRALAYHARSAAVRGLRKKAEAAIDVLLSSSPLDSPGLLPSMIDIRTGARAATSKTFGAGADSYYEYIVKMWIQGGKKEDKYKEIFRSWMQDLRRVVLEIDDDMYFVQMLSADRLTPRMDHYTCFLPGAIYLGIEAAVSEAERHTWQSIAERITRTCMESYRKTRVGLSGDDLRLLNGALRVFGGHHLRPEVLEAIFYMWRWTRDPMYRDWAWEIFERTERVCKSEVGYTPVANVNSSRPKYLDVMHSFFLSESLKYMHLIFSEDRVLPLDKYVLNTEAHPLLIMPNIGEVE
ncbi:hypothetical protein NDN08_003691 [Rhodosorus marinus]|uniref:alpha-1,2-Mannosidase n=1 Tax=Rhodosorus marinus TaxID=101924 RepID=A0AAV8UYC4_9RHOD|nr:hypothetical protein NDN08_003691 [Rhodosorus marinus]